MKAADVMCSALGIGLDEGNSLTEGEWKFLKLQKHKKRAEITRKIEEEYPYYRDFVMGNTPS